MESTTERSASNGQRGEASGGGCASTQKGPCACSSCKAHKKWVSKNKEKIAGYREKYWLRLSAKRLAEGGRATSKTIKKLRDNGMLPPGYSVEYYASNKGATSSKEVAEKGEASGEAGAVGTVGAVNGSDITTGGMRRPSF